MNNTNFNDLKDIKFNIPGKKELLLIQGNEFVYKVGMMVFLAIIMYEVFKGERIYATNSHVCMFLFWLVGMFFHGYIKYKYGIIRKKDKRN